VGDNEAFTSGSVLLVAGIVMAGLFDATLFGGLFVIVGLMLMFPSSKE